MVTASHNPKEDNGYKVYWNNGAQIISPNDKNIQAHILENLEWVNINERHARSKNENKRSFIFTFRPQSSSWDLDSLKSPLLNDPYREMFELYYEKLLANIPSEVLSEINAKSDMRFVYSAMHGVGYKFVEKALEIANLKPLIPVAEQRDADPEFPTVKFPNPEEGKSSLTLSFKLANESKCNVILANDPDADRLACAELREK